MAETAVWAGAAVALGGLRKRFGEISVFGKSPREAGQISASVSGGALLGQRCR